MEIIKQNSLRSRYALFIGSADSRKNGKVRRCREPSRLPLKQMKRILKKRKLRKRIRNYVLKNVPKTSRLYQIMQAPILRKIVTNGQRIPEGNEFTMTDKFLLRNGCKCMRSTNEKVYKSLNHKINNIATKLSGDIEKNPGPFGVDPSKTIVAPYSQGNSVVFGSNAGKQCVAMSLIAILFDFMFSIRSSTDLVEIMNFGNELYTRLSHSAGQQLLMLKELPEVLCVRETMYRVKYSDSYFGNVHNFNDYTVDSHCLPLIEAFELLLRENFKSFIVTITICTVGVLLKSNGTFKVFDSHSRDSEGMFDPCGNCVLIEIASLDKLVEYFENLYIGSKDAVYELKGAQILTDGTGNVDLTRREISLPVNIENLNVNQINSVGSQESDTFCSCPGCCFICFYAICFSVLKDIRYWNENTLDAIIEKSNQLHESIMLKEHCTVSDLPDSLTIDVANIEARFNVVYKETKKEQESLFVVQEMENVIRENQADNT